MTRRPCPVCAGTDAAPLHRQRAVLPDGHLLAGEHDVACCARCGMVYADTPHPQEIYDRYYAALSKYADLKTSSGSGLSSSDAARLRGTAELLARHVPKAARTLDLGCANGGLLGFLKAEGFSDLVGVDPSAACVRNTREAHGVEAHVGSFLELPAGVGKAGAVILSHVLEHVRDVPRILDVLDRLLDEGGWLYVETPDARRYETFIAAPLQDFNVEHINHFSAAALENLFGAAGYETVEIAERDIESSPGVPYPAVAAVLRKRRGTARAPVRDEALRPAIDRYLSRSHALLERIDAHLRAVRARHPRIALWGVGQLAFHLLAETALREFAFAAFVDGNDILHGSTLLGVPIRPPASLRDTDVPVLIASLIHERAITRAMREDLKLPNEIIPLRLPDAP